MLKFPWLSSDFCAFETYFCITQASNPAPLSIHFCAFEAQFQVTWDSNTDYWVLISAHFRCSSRSLSTQIQGCWGLILKDLSFTSTSLQTQTLGLWVVVSMHLRFISASLEIQIAVALQSFLRTWGSILGHIKLKYRLLSVWFCAPQTQLYVIQHSTPGSLRSHFHAFETQIHVVGCSFSCPQRSNLSCLGFKA